MNTYLYHVNQPLYLLWNKLHKKHPTLYGYVDPVRAVRRMVVVIAIWAKYRTGE